MSNDDFNYYVRISGTDLSGEWFVGFALSRIRGIGLRLSHLILKKLDISPDSRIGFLAEENVKKIEEVIKNPVKFGIPPFMVNRQHDPITGEHRHINGRDMPVFLKADLDRMKKIRSYKGIRHTAGLRVRGQHTRTTGRGGRAVGVSRKKQAQ